MKQEAPDNRYQIGTVGTEIHIWIEDYVLSFLKSLDEEKDFPILLAFFGDGGEQDGCRQYFLKGAAAKKPEKESAGRYRDGEAGEKRASLADGDRAYFQKIRKKYFGRWKGIGWCFLDSPRDVLGILRDMREQPFEKIKGYYIYYENNERMQEYFVSWNKREKKSAALRRKKLVKKRTGGIPVFSGSVQLLNIISLCILIISCIIAVTTLNQYDKMIQLEETIIRLEAYVEQQKNLPEE